MTRITRNSCQRKVAELQGFIEAPKGYVWELNTLRDFGHKVVLMQVTKPGYGLEIDVFGSNRRGTSEMYAFLCGVIGACQMLGKGHDSFCELSEMVKRHDEYQVLQRKALEAKNV